MPPPTATYPISALEAEINLLPNGKPRKPPVTLSDCALKELAQYKCNLHWPEGKKRASPPDIVCKPVVRWLRMCQSGLSVETTSWEACKAKKERVSRLDRDMA